MSLLLFAKFVNRFARLTLGSPQLLEPSGPIKWQLNRRFGRLDHQLVREYLNSFGVRKLHIGCGKHVLVGWLNTDFLPYCPNIVHLDATRPFAFDDATFDYVYSEHMIEHISYQAGQHMLKECHRVLNASGKIRISTPDLAFLLDLYQNKKSQLQVNYIKWATQLSAGDGKDNAVFVINNFMRSWGHTFIYDENTLRQAMTDAGFVNIVKRPLQESEDPILRNLENESRMPPGFLRLESLTLEARKSG